MSRVQLALNVSDIDEAVSFYSKLFGVEPAKRRLGYANFAIGEPPLKLVLFQNPGQAGTLNHLGVEVTTTEEVAGASRRLQSDGLAVETEEKVDCCYAVQDKVWVSGADTRWEVYTVIADSPQAAATCSCEAGAAANEACCAILHLRTLQPCCSFACTTQAGRRWPRRCSSDTRGVRSPCGLLGRSRRIN
jgi:catechol 2,3-dioxygenase-like lactoylglutathione lyase family enzyme